MDQTQILQFVNHGSLARLIEAVGDDRLMVKKVLLIAPSKDDFAFVKRVFPSSLIFVSYLDDWDLNSAPPRNFPTVDVAISMNVLMYSDDPAKWISNILLISNRFIFLDIKYRKRSSGPFALGEDGDRFRYSLHPESTSRQPTFALSSTGYAIEQYLEFQGARNEFHDIDDPPIHICASITADISKPVTIQFSDRVFLLGHNFFIARLRTIPRRIGLKLKGFLHSS